MAQKVREGTITSEPGGWSRSREVHGVSALVPFMWDLTNGALVNSCHSFSNRRSSGSTRAVMRLM